MSTFGILGFSGAMGQPPKQVSRPSSPRRGYSKEIPVDLLIDIFSRLTTEDVARCRCVSKLWANLLRRPYFTDLFLKLSTARPRLLFTFIHNGRRLFYSMPQTLDPDRNYSSTIYPHYHMGFPKGLGSPEETCPPILGLVCTTSRKPMICNPSTGEYISLPRASTKRVDVHASFGYDPIDKLFKVLCVSNDYVCRVSTLGTGIVSWRTIECSKPHKPLRTGICINGVLYYLARWTGNINGTPTLYLVVCFDVRTESFKFVAVDINIECAAVVNYKGKLGILWIDWVHINERTKSFKLWVLEDVDEPKWLKSLHILPDYWKNIAADTNLYIVGLTSADEIVLSSGFLVAPFYIFYYNIVKNSVVRLEIKFGVEAYKNFYPDTFTFIDHVENVELMD